MERYSRRNHSAARRHYRVAKKEVALNPEHAFSIPKKHKKLLIGALGVVVAVELIVTFLLGFFVGRKTA